jgi:hypothetical protein
MPFTNTYLEARAIQSKLLTKSAFRLKWVNTKNVFSNLKKYIFKPKIGTVILPVVLLMGCVLGALIVSPLSVVRTYFAGAFQDNASRNIPEIMKIQNTDDGVGVQLKKSDTLTTLLTSKKIKNKPKNHE